MPLSELASDDAAISAAVKHRDGPDARNQADKFRRASCALMAAHSVSC
jgi:hypothetical protein